jgi:hypothetical protein
VVETSEGDRIVLVAAGVRTDRILDCAANALACVRALLTVRSDQ